jgi:hypothetical protein
MSILFEGEYITEHIIDDRSIQGIKDKLPLLYCRYKPRPLEFIEMVRDARSGHAKFVTDLARRHVVLPEQFQDFSPGWIIQRFKYVVHDGMFYD